MTQWSSPTETIVTRFRSIAARFGARLAVAAPGKQLTYRELDEHSDRLGQVILSCGGDPFAVIAISLSNWCDLVIAMFAILKTGAAFTVIDPDMPAARKQASTDAMTLRLVIGDSTTGPWPGYNGIWLNPIPPPARDGIRLPDVVDVRRAALIVQTSGTTGTPVGVEISHAALLHTVGNYTKLVKILPEDRLTVLSLPAYFAANTAIFSGLLNGASIHPFDVRVSGLEAMVTWLQNDRLTIYQSTPSLFRAFGFQAAVAGRFPHMRLVRLGGETVLGSDYRLFRKLFPIDACFMNTLGMSEAGGNVAYLIADETSHAGMNLLPVGIPSLGQEIVLLDDSGCEVAPGEIGEIVVRGNYLASGYYKNRALTAKRFKGEGQQRGFHSGDLGYLVEDGELMHCGRKDDQIKIRGRRIDLSGLQAIIESLEEVARAVVLKKPEPADELAAFIVPATKTVTLSLIRSRLTGCVPHFMIPASIYLVEDFPLNDAGKLDRQNLLLAGGKAWHRPPAVGRNKIEVVLVELWRDCLGSQEFGLHDDFFSVGGDSLKALTLTMAMSAQFGRQISPLLLLEYNSIAQLATVLAAFRPQRKYFRWYGRSGAVKSAPAVALRSAAPTGQHPLFIYPGGFASENELMIFASLARFLPADRPVYGLWRKHLRKFGTVSETVAEIAKELVAAVQVIQPVGPYYLLGECIGSVVVLEMARQLRATGADIGRLILLDPRLPNIGGDEFIKLPRHVKKYYAALVRDPLPLYRHAVHLVTIEEADATEARLAQWNVFDMTQLAVVRTKGDHASYIRDHASETARQIAHLLRPSAEISMQRLVVS